MLYSDAPIKDGTVNFTSMRRRSDRVEDDSLSVQTPHFSFEKSDSVEVFKRILDREKESWQNGTTKFRKSSPLKMKQRMENKEVKDATAQRKSAERAAC